VGKNVGGIAPGDVVNLIPSFSMNDYSTYGSTYGEVIIAPDYAVVRHPKSLPAQPLLGTTPKNKGLTRKPVAQCLLHALGSEPGGRARVFEALHYHKIQ
jgi:hypothetical protein